MKRKTRTFAIHRHFISSEIKQKECMSKRNKREKKHCPTNSITSRHLTTQNKITNNAEFSMSHSLACAHTKKNFINIFYGFNFLQILKIWIFKKKIPQNILGLYVYLYILHTDILVENIGIWLIETKWMNSFHNRYLNFGLFHTFKKINQHSKYIKLNFFYVCDDQ